MKYKSLHTTYSVVWKPKMLAFICRADTSSTANNHKQTVCDNCVCMCALLSSQIITIYYIIYIIIYYNYIYYNIINNINACLYAVIHDRHSFDSLWTLYFLSFLFVWNWQAYKLQYPFGSVYFYLLTIFQWITKPSISCQNCP